MGPVWQNPILRTVRTAHLSVLMTAPVQYTIQNRTVLIIYPLTSKRHISDVVCRRRGDLLWYRKWRRCSVVLALSKVWVMLVAYFFKVLCEYSVSVDITCVFSGQWYSFHMHVQSSCSLRVTICQISCHVTFTVKLMHRGCFNPPVGRAKWHDNMLGIMMA